MKKIKLTLMGILTLLSISCDLETDLDVENLESPSSAQIGIEATATKLFQNWYQAVNNYNGPGMALATMADQQTCSWGNAGMRDTSSEPRVEWNNLSTYSNGFITRDYFNSMYSILADANAIIASLQGEGVFSDDDKIESLARFAQAASMGSIALVFDRGWASDENGAINDGNALLYSELIDVALEKLDLAIAAADRGSFTIDSEINGVSLSSAQWSEFLNSYGARLLVNSPRNASQRASLDWSRVMNYASNGLSYNLSVLGDGYNSWYSEWMIYMIYPGWARTDLRVINLMDPSYPDYWPSGATVLPPANSADARLASDFEYMSSQDFIATRGTYHYSSYRHSRYDNYTNTSWEAAQPEFLKAENDLYLAEAKLRTGDVAGAAGVINASSRVLRGQLAPVASTVDDVTKAIHYERIIELNNTGMGLGFFEMRGKDLLQSGTLLHFPVPGAALDAAKIDIYTFGGSTGVPGQDVSNGGWR